MNTADLTIKGIYRDILIRDRKIVHDSRWMSNTIVTRGRTLLAAFVKNDNTRNILGVQYLAVGQGSEAWDNGEPPVPDPGATVLVNPHDPPIVWSDLDLVYLDETDAVVPGPTSRLQITATLEPGYPAPLPPLTSYPLREFGLFGGIENLDVEPVVPEPYMINSVRHPVIHKDESATLIRVIRLYF